MIADWKMLGVDVDVGVDTFVDVRSMRVDFVWEFESPSKYALRQIW
jgi:hypothetical protein